MVVQWNLYNQNTIGGQYEFRSFVLCREVVLFSEVQKLWGNYLFGTSKLCGEVYYFVSLLRTVRRFTVVVCFRPAVSHTLH